MKKRNFVAMVMGTLLAVGMCMCLLPEWNAFTPGVVMGCVGLGVLVITVKVWRKMENKAPIHLTGKTVVTVALGIIGALLLGVGMCLLVVWSNVVFGIIVGTVGMFLLLSLIPLTQGVKES